MNISIAASPAGVWTADCAVLFLFQGEAAGSAAPGFVQASPWLAESPALEDFSGKKGEEALVYQPDGSQPARVLMVGLGKPEKCTANDFRAAVAKTVKGCAKRGFASLDVPAEGLRPVADSLDRSLETILKETACSALLALYRLDAYKSEPPEDQEQEPETLTLLWNGQKVPDLAERAVREGVAEAAGILLAQNLGNGPANWITPVRLEEEAGKLAERHGFSFSSFGPDQIREKGMGAFWAVAQGAIQEPRLLVLEHCPEGREEDQPLVFVGKGITFDTGGISLKPSAKMHEMKGDMGGAAAVLGFFEALGNMGDKAELPRVIGIIPATENVTGSRAVKPGDVVTSLSGKTIEILNTDAEGRLLLCDALAYAQENWKPKVLVDIATLTGACVVALGDYATGLFSDDQPLRELILEAAESVGDLFWPMPLWNEYEDKIRSDVADLANVGPREGGSIFAALFLRKFIKDGVRWAHLDIAGPGYVVTPSPLHPVAGSTGVGVRLFCRLLRQADQIPDPE